MNHRHNARTDLDGGRMRGFVAYVAIALWFLLVILGAGRAAAQDAALTAQQMLPSIEETLSAHGAPAGGVVHLDNPALPVAVNSFTHVSYNPLSGRFVIRMDQDGVITGVVTRMQRYAIVNRAIARGEVIGEADIDYLDAPATAARGVAEDAATLIGKSARRAIAANKPIRIADLETPMLVKKGAIVTLTYEADGLRMSHQGVAMHNGGVGDVVSVKNIKSDITLKGVVADRNLVSIIPHHAAFKG